MSPHSSDQSEIQLARSWQIAGNQAALQSLVEPLIPRVLRLGRRLSASQAEDLAAEGMVALIEAVGRWPGASHGDLTAFVWPAVKGAMLRARARTLTTVSIPERRLRDGLAGRKGTADRAELHLLMNSETFDEFESAASVPASEDLALDAERSRTLRRALAHALRPLSRVERHLVIRHLLHEAAGLDHVAEGLALSPARARSLEGRALHKMRHNLIRNGFMKSDLL